VEHVEPREPKDREIPEHDLVLAVAVLEHGPLHPVLGPPVELETDTVLPVREIDERFLVVRPEDRQLDLWFVEPVIDEGEPTGRLER
jgi:hypothetical protein